MILEKEKYMLVKKTEENDYYIHIEEGEDAQTVLAAIIVASVEFSYPRGGFETSQPAVSLDEAKRELRLNDQYTIILDYIGRHLCKTTIMTTKDVNTFVLMGHTFETNRGDPTPMFERAKEILNPELEKTADFRQMQRGVGLDYLTAPYGFKRNEGETDEQYIKRIFIPLEKVAKDFALQITFGMRPDDWSSSISGLVLMAGMMNQLHDQSWIDGFAGDPIWFR